MLSADSLELSLTMAPVNAQELLRLPSAARITRDAFDSLRPRLLELAPRLCTVISQPAPRQPSVAVEFTEEGDLTFTLTFVPAPAKTFRIDAMFLRELGSEFTAMLVVTDADGNDLGWDQLTAERSYLETVLPRPPKP